MACEKCGETEKVLAAPDGVHLCMRCMASKMATRIREAAGARLRKPLCEATIHPFLGNGVFQDTCPQCGFKKLVN